MRSVQMSCTHPRLPSTPSKHCTEDLKPGFAGSPNLTPDSRAHQLPINSNRNPGRQSAFPQLGERHLCHWHPRPQCKYLRSPHAELHLFPAG